jgi:hypothetical protein
VICHRCQFQTDKQCKWYVKYRHQGWFGCVKRCRVVHEHGERAERTALGLSSSAVGKGYSMNLLIYTEPHVLNLLNLLNSSTYGKYWGSRPPESARCGRDGSWAQSGKKPVLNLISTTTCTPFYSHNLESWVRIRQLLDQAPKRKLSALVQRDQTRVRPRFVLFVAFSLRVA